jgi:hypothetical protein
VRVLRGRDRDEAERSTALRSHYGFDSLLLHPEVFTFQCGLSSRLGLTFRLAGVPVPAAASLAALNELIAAADPGPMTAG